MVSNLFGCSIEFDYKTCQTFSTRFYRPSLPGPCHHAACLFNSTILAYMGILCMAAIVYYYNSFSLCYKGQSVAVPFKISFSFFLVTNACYYSESSHFSNVLLCSTFISPTVMYPFINFESASFFSTTLMPTMLSSYAFSSEASTGDAAMQLLL